MNGKNNKKSQTPNNNKPPTPWASYTGRKDKNIMNTINLIGRLTADPEFKTTGRGKNSTTYLNLFVAVPLNEDVTDFIPCTAFGKCAEFITAHFGKGERIGITGRLTSSQYEDKNGDKRTSYSVIIDRAFFCESAGKRGK